MAMRPKYSDWVKETKISLQPKLSRAELTKARQTFERDLDSAEQMRLAQEIVKTRTDELCRAYRNLVAVSVGHGVRREKGRGKTRLVRRPCVIFLVKKKWADQDSSKSAELLPKFLLSYWNVGLDRKLCAVPTDVDDAQTYSRIRPEAVSKGIEVVPTTGQQPEFGTLTCALRRSLFPAKTFTLSCRHVFSVSSTLHDTPIWGSKVRIRQGGQDIGLTRSVAGRLRNGPEFSFDAQLAEVTDGGALQRALGDISFSSVAQGGDDVPKDRDYWILTPGGAVKAAFRQFMTPSPPISYGQPGIESVVHEELLQSLLTTSTNTHPGDSGSALATEKNGGVLLGMHIARDGELTYAIPAWQLVNPSRYERASNVETWAILQSQDIEGLGAVATTASPVVNLAELRVNHNFNGSIVWRLSRNGVVIADGTPETTEGQPATVKKVWENFGDPITRHARHFGVPVELIIATICTESSGNPGAVREEPGFRSDSATPARVSVGLMQTLISTARNTLSQRDIGRQWLFKPGNSIQAGTAYIAKQKSATGFDPPKVACAYNAGSLLRNGGQANRWKMKQFPVGTGKHADRFVRWFNDCFRYFRARGVTPSPSFFELV